LNQIKRLHAFLSESASPHTTTRTTSGDSRIKKVGGANINVYLTWWFFVFLKIKSLWFTLSNPTWACEYR